MYRSYFIQKSSHKLSLRSENFRFTRMVYLAFLVGDNRVQIFQTLSGPYTVTVHNVDPKLLMYSKKMEKIGDEIIKLVGRKEKTRIHNLGFGGKCYVVDLDYDDYRTLEMDLDPTISPKTAPRKGWIMIFKSRAKTIKGSEIAAAIRTFTSNV